MLHKVQSHGLDIDVHQRTELQLLLVHKHFGRARAVHSDQIGRKCDQIFADVIIFWTYTRHLRLKYLPTSHQATELWSSQKLKNYIQDRIWLFEQA